VAAHVEALQNTAAKPTVKQHRSIWPPSACCSARSSPLTRRTRLRGPKHVVKRGKTPVLTEEEARRLLESIKVTKEVNPAR
jgi:hypothetical protein